MVRSELIKKLSDEHPDLPLEVAKVIVNTVFTTIVSALADGRRVEIRGFGSFVSKVYETRRRRNPKTGEAVRVPATRLPRFKAGKLLLSRLNQKP